MIYQYESWLPVAMDWYCTTRFWNHILQVIPGFGREQGMGYDLRPPNVAQSSQQVWNQEKTWTYFLLLPSRPRACRVAEWRATHQTPLESRKIPSKLWRGNLMGRTALKSVGKNPKPTGTFRPGAERAKKSRPQEPKNEHILIYQHKSWLPEAMDWFWLIVKLVSWVWPYTILVATWRWQQ